MNKLKNKIKKAKTISDLEVLEIGNLIVNISHRGGGIGFRSNDVSKFFGVQEYQLPKNFGAGCNYLGGGIRGSIFPSTFSKEITGEKEELLKELANACVRAYENAENRSGLNDEEYADGETNWEARATKDARNAGRISAY